MFSGGVRSVRDSLVGRSCVVWVCSLGMLIGVMGVLTAPPVWCLSQTGILETFTGRGKRGEKKKINPSTLISACNTALKLTALNPQAGNELVTIPYIKNTIVAIIVISTGIAEQQQQYSDHQQQFA